jgi:hypothetical protein
MADENHGGRGIIKPVLPNGKRASQLMYKDAHIKTRQVAHSHQMQVSLER